MQEVSLEQLRDERKTKEADAHNYRRAVRRYGIANDVAICFFFPWVILLLLFFPWAQDRGLIRPIVFAVIVYAPFLVYYGLASHFRGIAVKMSQAAAFCAAMDASEELRRGNLIKSSLIADEMLVAVNFSLHAKLNVGPWRTAPNMLKVLYLASLKKARGASRRIMAALQNSGDRANEFDQRLTRIAQAFRTPEDDSVYLTTDQSLRWLIEQGDRYPVDLRGKLSTIRIPWRDVLPVVALAIVLILSFVR